MTKIICTVLMSVLMFSGIAMADQSWQSRRAEVETKMICENGRMFLVTIIEGYRIVGVSTVQVFKKNGTSDVRPNQPVECR